MTLTMAEQEEKDKHANILGSYTIDRILGHRPLSSRPAPMPSIRTFILYIVIYLESEDESEEEDVNGRRIKQTCHVHNNIAYQYLYSC